MRAEQTVSEMVVETLTPRAEAVSKIESKTFEEAFAKVLKTPAGRRLAELADGPHRHEKAAEWQAGLTQQHAKPRGLGTCVVAPTTGTRSAKYAATRGSDATWRGPTATVKSIEPDAFMDQAASSYVIAVRV